MIELRWIEREEERQGAGETPYSVTVRVLQYRQQEPDWGGHNEEPDMRWTDWVDVPLVTQP